MGHPPCGFDHVSTTKSNSTRSIDAHPFDKLSTGSCKKRKGGALSVGMVHARVVKGGTPVQKTPPEWWEIACEGDELKKCREDPRFPYLVTLARATNALNLATAILPHIEDSSSPVGARELIPLHLRPSV